MTEVNLPIDKLSKRIKGFAHVTFMFPEHAVKAFNKLDGTNYKVCGFIFSVKPWFEDTGNGLYFQTSLLFMMIVHGCSVGYLF